MVISNVLSYLVNTNQSIFGIDWLAVQSLNHPNWCFCFLFFSWGLVDNPIFETTCSLVKQYDQYSFEMKFKRKNTVGGEFEGLIFSPDQNFPCVMTPSNYTMAEPPPLLKRKLQHLPGCFNPQISEKTSRSQIPRLRDDFFKQQRFLFAQKP